MVLRRSWTSWRLVRTPWRFWMAQRMGGFVPPVMPFSVPPPCRNWPASWPGTTGRTSSRSGRPGAIHPFLNLGGYHQDYIVWHKIGVPVNIFRDFGAPELLIIL